MHSQSGVSVQEVLVRGSATAQMAAMGGEGTQQLLFRLTVQLLDGKEEGHYAAL